MTDRIEAAYGGAGWSPRTQSSREEIGRIWRTLGVDTEWRRLRAVLLHCPGPEWEAIADPNLAQMLERPELAASRAEHRALAEAYRACGVTVNMMEPEVVPPPNLLFVADLLFSTPEGVILGRPASTVRAGEECFVARRLAHLGIPVVGMVHGTGVFEGADAMWVDPETVLVASGLRTNDEGAAQVTRILREMGVETVPVGLPFGAMHLMGTFRIVDRDLAFTWANRVPFRVVEVLRARGFEVRFMPDEAEVIDGSALNIVVVGPRRIVMPAGCPVSQACYEESGVSCTTVEVGELMKAAGSIGCMTGVLERDRGCATG
ncbi:MAG: arginine deiminase family protein [Candidatus Eisenbacteria bacterium]|nr:arginine deiminase family protein [Candidatus Eisenbacteria bacterium]